ncbi:hypothetical protein [Selenomonas ruminantium]|uniref:AP2 domain-containing protein n=1 Tax=Selenomonas ruminantium TaxID=971 RepID=A0A1I0YA89_SELRU|nr:hypothetical protein [Selenomonas ruminantium]SFB10181.1 hypothetical protein SAMN05216587_11141 [Selenomonas ruminantium]
MVRYEPRQREAIDGVVWWVPYDMQKNRYSTLLCHGKYRTKKACAAAIKFYEHCYRGN